MAYDLPTIPDDKINYFREQLYREISNLFEWEGMPDEIPLDYLERTLIRHGTVMFFKEEETYGYMALRCSARYYNVYGQPTQAYAVTPNMEQNTHYRERTVAYQYTQELNPDDMCVIIQNMEGGQPISQIVDFYATRMALIFQAFDTNALWQNVPQIFRVNDKTLKLTIEKLFSDVQTGKPFVVVDKEMLGEAGGVQTDEITAEFRLDKLLDVYNELKGKFYETVGINTPGADKKERLITDEVNANNQSTQTALQVMLSMREKAAMEIGKLYPDLTITVKLKGEEDPEEVEEEEEVEEDGDGDDGAEGRSAAPGSEPV